MILNCVTGSAVVSRGLVIEIYVDKSIPQAHVNPHALLCRCKAAVFSNKGYMQHGEWGVRHE